MQEMMKMNEIISYIEAKKDELIKISDQIWDYAELKNQEFKSAALLSTALAHEGFAISENVAGLKTAFVAEAGKGSPIIGFLGEYDALPDLSQEAGETTRKPVIQGGAGHGCGHHILGTAAMGAAVVVKKYLEDHKIPGTIRFYGCPAEEGGSGKVIMGRAGSFDDVEAAITWHPTDDNNIWSMNFLATLFATFHFEGIAAHSASQGHLGRSALEAVELMNVGANYLRAHVTRDVCINYAVLDAGGIAPNTIQAEATVAYLLRANTQAETQRVFERLVDIAQGAALMSGTKMSYHIDSGTSELIPNRALERIMYDKFVQVGPVPIDEDDIAFAKEIRKSFPKNAEESTISILKMLYGSVADEIVPRIRGKLINDCIYPYVPIEMAKYGSTDVCDVSWYTPVAQVTTACYAKDTPGHSWQETAQGKTNLCHKGMLTAAKVMALTGIELVVNPASLKAVRDEYCQKRQGRDYVCPLPE
jgi:aminobenzoyl-glutamate utilization protein B